jgi:MATE family, multidrug efflux pump
MSDTESPRGKRARPKLTEGPVGRRLFMLALPMLGGTFAICAFNLADTYFVARLGTSSLAAMGFTFPVVMFLGSIAHGLGMGATTVVSHLIGEGNEAVARRVTTHSLMLALLIVAVLSIAGLSCMDVLFRKLGATGDVLLLVKQYMVVWYAGIVFMIVPMFAGSIIRATGDTVSPSAIMIVGSVLNVVLDPIMIFGLWGCPAFGLRGAALATVISRAFTLVAAMLVLHCRHRLLEFALPSLNAMWASWRRVLHIGVPSGATNILVPLSAGIITRIVAGFGEEAVAACGAGARLEMFAFMIPMALGISLVPFIGQNWGAGRKDRVTLCRKYSTRFALYWGVCCAVAFMLLSGRMAALFTKDPRVLDILSLYLCVIPLGYGMREIHRYVGFSFNAIGRPMSSAAINAIRVLVLLLPITILGARLYGLPGVFWGSVAADVLGACVALLWARRLFGAS